MTNLKVTDLKEMAKELKIKNWWTMKKDELIKAIELKSKEDYTSGKPQELKLLTEHYQDCDLPQLRKELKLISEEEKESGHLNIVEKNYLEDRVKELQAEEEVQEIKKSYKGYTLKELKEELALLHEEDLEDEIDKVEEQALKELIAEKEPKTQEEDEDIITLKEIIADIGIKGTKARRILRGSDIERPYKRWEWHKEEHKEIIDKVTKLLLK